MMLLLLASCIYFSTECDVEMYMYKQYTVMENCNACWKQANYIIICMALHAYSSDKVISAQLLGCHVVAVIRKQTN